MDNSSATSTAVENEAEGTFDSVLSKAGALWDDTTATTGKVTQSVKGKVDEALGDGNLGGQSMMLPAALVRLPTRSEGRPARFAPIWVARPAARLSRPKGSSTKIWII